MNNDLDRITILNRNFNTFWSNSHGWASQEADEILSKSRLDLQDSLSQSLNIWLDKDTLSEGELILAWVNLGILLEGSMKFFLCVYLYDYQNTEQMKKIKKGIPKNILPDVASIAPLINYFNKNNLLEKNYFSKYFDCNEFMELVQKRRNAVHSFKRRELGTFSEYKECVSKYKIFLDIIYESIPYPSDNYRQLY